MGIAARTDGRATEEMNNSVAAVPKEDRPVYPPSKCVEQSRSGCFPSSARLHKHAAPLKKDKDLHPLRVERFQEAPCRVGSSEEGLRQERRQGSTIPSRVDI
jgi:hypothetical protein